MPTVAVSHKIRLAPTKAQEDYFRRACGTARYAFNWGLAKWQEQYKAGQKPNAYQLKALFRSVAPIEHPWIKEVTKCAAEQAFNDLAAAYRRFFKKQNKYPSFKKKGKSKDSFYLSNDQFKVQDKRVRIPKLGWVKIRESLRFDGHILAARISRVADQWHISIQVETNVDALPAKNQGGIGIDVGLNTFAKLSTNESFYAPKPLKQAQRKLKRLQRQHARKQKSSSNRRKATMKIARLHLRVANIRADFLHKLSTGLIREYSYIGLEDLNVAGMLKNHRLAKAIADVSWSEFKRQLTYKAHWHDRYLHEVDRFFPGSKLCSQCGQVQDSMPLNIRMYVCDCGSVMDRDHNAAVNILNHATAGLAGSNACGQNNLLLVAG